MSVVSLFSGCGGMDLGFAGGFEFLGRPYPETGFRIVWANDVSPAACATYRLNSRAPVIEGDVREALERLPAAAGVVIGGFPCQDVSVNGKMLGLKGTRTSLYTAMVEAVRRTAPLAFAAENVGGLLLKANAPA
ncbi:MAG: DNA cytosine methyltransferase, partial [Deltaproteobacteria bacterium]|nr:DNA cytosine methyltransferase [Deltaproteobacteria bacterium]